MSKIHLCSQSLLCNSAPGPRSPLAQTLGPSSPRGGTRAVTQSTSATSVSAPAVGICAVTQSAIFVAGWPPRPAEYPHSRPPGVRHD